MNSTLVRIDLSRHLRDVMNMMFVLVLPVFMYLIFGNIFGDSDEAVGRGNLKFYIMVSMAAYGAAVAATGIAGSAATEQIEGWGRQLALTRMTPRVFVASKAVVALLIATAATLVLFGVAVINGAQADSVLVWLFCLIVIVVGSALFGLYGLAVALWFKSNSALSTAAAGLTFLAFLGNVFIPLNGTMLTVAKFTPMYGYVGLVRYPLTDGYNGDIQDPVWLLLANLVGWAAIFALWCLLAVRRTRERR